MCPIMAVVVVLQYIPASVERRLVTALIVGVWKMVMKMEMKIILMKISESDSPVDMSTFTPERIASTFIPSVNDDKILRENIAI